MSHWMPTHRDCSCVKLSSANHDLFRCTILLRHRCANQRRCDLHYDGLSDVFFVSEQGRHLHFAALSRCFRHLIRKLGLAARDSSRGPSLHSLRHTFAVSRLRKWQQEGADVTARLPHLAVYMGHAVIEDTYWYLTATPELLTSAGYLFAVHADGEGKQ